MSFGVMKVGSFFLLRRLLLLLCRDEKFFISVKWNESRKQGKMKMYYFNIVKGKSAMKYQKLIRCHNEMTFENDYVWHQ